MKTNTGTFVLYDLPVILYAALIFILSSLPSTSLPDTLFNFQDKVLHFFEFALFAFFFQRMLFRRRPFTSGWLLFSIFVCIVWAGLDELHQLFVPGRYCDITDVYADTTGILVSHFFGILVRRRAVS